MTSEQRRADAEQRIAQIQRKMAGAESVSAPLHAQPAPKVVRKQGVRTTWLELTASPEMITAYLEWLESPAAHEAFGTWADSQGLDSWS